MKMKPQRLTKTLIAQHMKKIARNPDLATLQAGAALLYRTVVPGEGGILFYARELYLDFAALQDTLLLDLGNASRSLYQKSETPTFESSETTTAQKDQGEEELERLERQIERMWLTLKAAQAALEAAQEKEQDLRLAEQLPRPSFALGQGVVVQTTKLQTEGMIYCYLPERLYPYHVVFELPEGEESRYLPAFDGLYGISLAEEELASLYGPLPASLVAAYQRRRYGTNTIPPVAAGMSQEQIQAWQPCQSKEA